MGLHVMEAAATNGERGQARFEVTITSKNQVTLPADLCRSLGLERGDRLELIMEPDGTVRMIPRRVVPDLRQFVGIWRNHSFYTLGSGQAYVEEVRGPVEPEDS